MDQNLIAAYGSTLYTMLAPMANEEIRFKAWEELLIDNQEGIVINADGSLHYDDHKLMLQDVVAAREYLASAWDMLTAIPGVVTPASISDTLVGYMDRNQFNAQVSMNMSDRQSQQTDYAWSWVPQPIYHADFHVPWRQEGFSYKQSDGVSAATIAVTKKRDEVLIGGDSSIAVNVNGSLSTLTGLINSPGTLLQPGAISDWADPANVDDVYPEAVDILATMFTTDRAAQTPNSVIMMVANDIYPQLELVKNAGNSERTNRERIMAIAAIRDVVPNEFLPDGSVLLVEATPMAIRIPMSSDITIAPWVKRDRFESQRFTIFGASTLQVREDRNGRSGVSYITAA